MSRLKLTTLIVGGFAAMFAILLITNIFSIRGVEEQKKLSLDFQGITERAALSSNLELGLEKQSAGVRAFALTNSDKLLARDEEGKNDFVTAMSTLQKSLKNPKAREIADQIDAAYPPYRKALDSEISLTRAGKRDEVEALLVDPQVAQYRTDLRKLLVEFQETETQLRQRAMDRQLASQNASERWGLMLLGASLLCAFFATRQVIVAVRQKTEGLRTIIERLTNGEMNIPDAEVLANDEIGQSVTLLNTMKHKIHQALVVISKGAEDIARASAEIATAAEQQARGAEAQRGHSLQVTSAMHEMTATIHEVAQNTSSVAKASDEATDIAGEGGDIVNRSLAAMRTIAEAVESTAGKVEDLGRGSERIGQIVRVIDEIAGQTNLLALNAAIEAARAGDAGRGFAVVAGEVRRLAERTGNATKEIGEMIASIQHGTDAAVESMEHGRTQVEQGVSTTGQAGESLSRIIATVGQVGHMVAQIAAASTEQASAAEEVQSSMLQISNMVQQSADAASATDKACGGLNRLAESLRSSVAQFQI